MVGRGLRLSPTGWIQSPNVNPSPPHSAEGRMIGPFTQRLMDWVHEEGHCSAEVRDLDWVDFFNLLFSGRLEPTVLADVTAAEHPVPVGEG